MSRIVLFNSLSVNLDSATFEITRQRTFMAVGMEPGDFITFEIVKVAPGARSFVCGCRVSDAGVGVIEGVQELQCPSCEALTQRPVRLTPQNPVVVLDFPQATILRVIYHGTGIDLGLVTVWTDETNTQDLDDDLRGCPPIFYADADQVWLPTGNIRCAPDQTTLEIEEVNECERTRWTPVPAGQVWTDTANVRCLEDGLTVEVEQTNQCDDRRWANAGFLQVWQDTGVRRCVNDLVQVQEVNNCGRLRWVPTAVFCENSQHSVVALTVAPNPGPEGTLFCWTVELDAPVVGLPLVIAGLLTGVEQDTNSYPHPVALILPGQNSGQLCVLTNDDTVVQGNRPLCLKLLPTTRIINELPPVCATVTDNDAVGPQPSVHTVTGVQVTNDGAITEGDEICWLVTLDAPVAQGALTLNFGLSGSEQVVQNYPAPVVVIAEGDSTGLACVQTLDDAVVEATLQLCLNVLLSPRVVAAPAAVCADVLDNDVAPPVDSVHNIVSLTVAPPSAVEGSQFCWTVNLDAPVVNSPLALTGVLSGQEQVNEGYAAPTVIIPVGASSGVLCVTTNPNTVIDPDRDLCLTVQAMPRLLSIPAPVCATVLNDDVPVGDSVHTVASVTVAPLSAVEGSTFCWTVTLNAPVTGSAVNVTGLLSGLEQANEGYAAPTGIIGVGQSSVQLCVATNDNAIVDATRGLCLAVQLTPRITAAPAVVCASVLNDDVPEAPSNHTVVSVTVAPPSAVEGSQFCWTVTLNAPVTVAPLVIQGLLSGAEQAINSYPSPAGVITVGQSSVVLCVTTLDNAILDGNRALCLAVQTGGRILAVPAAVCATVVDDEVPISNHDIVDVGVTPPEFGVEGTTFCWTVTLDDTVTGAPLTLVGILSGQEQTNQNYPNPSVVIPTGSSSGVMCVTTVDNAVVDGDRDLCLQVQAQPRLNVIPGPTCSLVIDNEVAPPVLPGGLVESGGCIVDDPSTGLSTYFLNVASDGNLSERTSGGGINVTQWKSPGQVSSNYEVRFDGPATIFNVQVLGPARNTWFNLGTSRNFLWQVAGPGPKAATLSGTLRIRRVGDVAEVSVDLVDLFISLGVICP